MLSIEIWKERPQIFKPAFESVGCYFRANGHVLFLKRSMDLEWEAGKWGGVGGRIEDGESPEEAMAREAKEEIGVVIAPKRFIFVRKAFAVFPGRCFIYHIFTLEFPKKPQIQLNGEHTDFVWILPNLALEELDLMVGSEEFIRFAFNM